MNALEQLRAFARYQTHAGYRWAMVAADGELLCEPCVRENYRQAYRATKSPTRGADDWRCVGLMNSGDQEFKTAEHCVHCGKVIFEADEST